MNSFFSNLFLAITENIRNDYTDNFDVERFGDEPKEKKTLKSIVLQKIKRKCRIIDYNEIRNVEMLDPYFDRMGQVYSFLEDDYSKDLYIQLIAYRILGYKKVKLPLMTSDYMQKKESSQDFRCCNDYIEAPFVDGRKILLYKHDLTKTDTPIVLYTSDVFPLLYINQYENENVRIETGDVVLDCGGCWGDTALFFANKVGNSGHVYSFEFIPENLVILKKNVSLNTSLLNRVSVIENALGEKTGETLFFSSNGPGSRLDNSNEKSIKVKSISIDDFVENNKLDKIDFIKMDIEGSELPSLKGAINVLKRYKPKLAISIYHSLDDFVDIPIYLESLRLGYRFFIKHGTIHSEETVLLAICK